MDELEEHDLAVGGTRPALMPYVGMPWTDFVIFLMAGVEALMFRVLLLIPIVVLFLCSLRLYRKDYNAGRCFICWATTSVRHMAADVFGGTFISPGVDPNSFRGIPHAD